MSGTVWRSAFVLGLLLAGAAGVAVLGERMLLFVAICAALTATLNGILGGLAPGERPYVQRAIRSALSVGWFFRLVTVTLWIGVFILAFAAFRSLRTLHEVIIEGHVYAANGEPAAYARIEIPATNTKATCDGAGAFLLTVEINRDATDFTIRARRGGYHVDQIARLDPANPHQRIGVILTLPKETPPFRVMYMYLKGRAVDLFLDPPRSEIWDRTLQEGAFIVRNDVFEALKDIRTRFSVPARHSVFYIGAEPGKPAEHSSEKLANDPPVRSAFVGSNGDNNGNGFDQHVDTTLADSDLRNLLFGRSNWSVLQRPPQTTYQDRPLPETVPLFRRNCEREDLTRFSDKSLLARFYAYIAGGDLPPDFAWVDLSIDYSACGDSEAPQLTLAGRLMVLEVAIVENIANEPIEVGPFNFHQSTRTELRPAGDPLADQPGAQQASWFAPRLLRSGERMVIPTRLLLEFKPEYSWNHTDSALPRVTDSSSLTSEMLFRFSSTPEEIVPFLANVPPNLDRQFVWGPSISLDTLQIEGIAYEVRAASSRNMLVLSGNEIGSCPYFSGYSQERGWVTGGTILRGRNSIARSGTDRRLLPAFDGRVLLEEREHEITFIEGVAVEVLTEDGHVHRLSPAITLPQHLSYGDRLEIPFRGMPKMPITRATLVVTGYYVQQ